MNNIRSLSQLLEDFAAALPEGEVTLAYILEVFHERGIGILLLLFAVPMALPVPVPPGINVMLASPLIFLTAQQAMGSHTVWLPRRLMHKSMPRDKLAHTVMAAIPWLKKIEKLIRPRLGWVTQDGPSRLMGVFSLIMALTVCIPLPLTNTVPSLGIALIALGVMMRDGLLVIIGVLVGLGWITLLTGAILFLGPEAFEIIKTTIKSLL